MAANLKKIHAGIGILLKHNPEDELVACHDRVSVEGVPPEVLSEEERSQLKALGWRPYKAQSSQECDAWEFDL